MKRLVRLFGFAELHVLAFFLCILLFHWSWIASDTLQGPGQVFARFFSAWIVAILVLFLIGLGSRAGQEDPASPENGKRTDEPGVDDV